MNIRSVTSQLKRGCIPVAVLLLCACTSQPDHPPLHPVQGTVRWQGESAAGAVVIFHPSDVSAPHPSAEVLADGTFALGTYATGDGAPAGSYGVTIEWPVPGKPLDGPGPDRLKGRYANPQQPTWTIEVHPQSNQLEPFVLQ